MEFRQMFKNEKSAKGMGQVAGGCVIKNAVAYEDLDTIQSELLASRGYVLLLTKVRARRPPTLVGS